MELGYLLGMEAVREVYRSLPECQIPLLELEQRIGAAVMDYKFAAYAAEIENPNPTQSRKLRGEVLKASRALLHWMKSPDYSLAVTHASGRSPITDEQVAAFVEWIEGAEKSTPKRTRGGLKDVALDALILTLAGIYTDATGSNPTSSRSTANPAPYGPWIDFFFAIISIVPKGLEVQSQGKAITAETFTEAFDTRWRRLLLHRQQSRNKTIRVNVRNESE